MICCGGLYTASMLLCPFVTIHFETVCQSQSQIYLYSTFHVQNNSKCFNSKCAQALSYTVTLSCSRLCVGCGIWAGVFMCNLCAVSPRELCLSPKFVCSTNLFCFGGVVCLYPHCICVCCPAGLSCGFMCCVQAIHTRWST